MKRFITSSVLFILCMSASLHLQAQGFQAREGGPASLIFLADGSLAEVEAKEGQLHFVSVNPPPQTTRSQYVVDVQEGDQITAVNGQTVQTLEAFDAVFDAVEAGETVTFALVREGRAHEVTFKKPTDEEMAETGLNVIRSLPGGASFVGADGEAVSPDEGGFTFISTDTPVTALQDENLFDLVGNIMEMEDEVLKMRLKLPHPQGASIALEPEDEVLKLNGEAITSVAQIRALYEGLEAGTSVALEIRRQGTTRTISFPKPDTP